MSALFNPVYNWQQQSWYQLTNQYPNIAHALLFAGNKGCGKLAFAEKFAAWLLCDSKNNTQNACGSCSNCNLLAAGNNPSFLRISVAEDSKSDIIKIEDIRQILPFCQQSSQGNRVVLIEQAERLNISSANALLKTLEEPAANVKFLLTCNQPQKLLPTILSRVQQCKVAQVSAQDATAYVTGLADFQALTANDSGEPTVLVEQLLAMAGGAPLAVNDLIASNWYAQRKKWLVIWQALRAGQRSPLAASEFWQKQINYADATILQQTMCNDVLSYIHGLPTLQQDMDFSVLSPMPTPDDVIGIYEACNEGVSAKRNNVQDNYLFDTLMHKLATS